MLYFLILMFALFHGGKRLDPVVEWDQYDLFLWSRVVFLILILELFHGGRQQFAWILWWNGTSTIC